MVHLHCSKIPINLCIFHKMSLKISSFVAIHNSFKASFRKEIRYEYIHEIQQVRQ